MLEQEIKNNILEYLMFRRDVFVFPIDSVGIFDPIRKIYRKKNSRFHIKGVSDILGITSKGVFLAIEVKSEKGAVRPDQKIFLDRISEMGGISFVARSVSDVVSALADI